MSGSGGAGDRGSTRAAGVGRRARALLAALALLLAGFIHPVPARTTPPIPITFGAFTLPAPPPQFTTSALARLAPADTGPLSTAGSGVAPLVLRAGAIEVIHWPGDEVLAQRALRSAARPLRLPGIPGLLAAPEARVVLAPSASAFDSITRGAPHWSAGIAVPSQRLIVLPAYASGRTPMGDPIVALRHELVHLALNEYLPRGVPRWFDEGYATWASGEWDAGRGWEIRLALFGGGVPPLDSLRLGWPGAQADARLAYLLSASAVSFLAERSGDEAFGAFLAEWRRQGGFDAALRSTYGLTLGQFEREWRAMVKRRYGWLLAVSQVGIFWALAALLLVVLTIPRRRRNREKLHRMKVDDWVEAWEGEVETKP